MNRDRHSFIRNVKLMCLSNCNPLSFIVLVVTDIVCLEMAVGGEGATRIQGTHVLMSAESDNLRA